MKIKYTEQKDKFLFTVKNDFTLYIMTILILDLDIYAIEIFHGIRAGAHRKFLWADEDPRNFWK